MATAPGALVNVPCAAAALINRHRWFTPALGKALLAALPYDDGDLAWPTAGALRTMAAHDPELLPDACLPFRHALSRDEALAQKVAVDPI